MSSTAKYASLKHRISVVALICLILPIIVFSICVPYKPVKEVTQAWVGVALAAVSAAISIASAISANNKKKKLAAQMEKMKLNKPAGLTNAENTLSALASQGLPGKDLMEDALKEPLAQSLTNMRELGASPVTIAGMASQGMSDVTGNIRQLMVEDASAKMGNMVNLANFQAGPLAQFDLQQQEFNMNKQLGADYARMEGTAELYQGIANGVGTLGSAVGNQQYLNYLKGLNTPSSGGSSNGMQSINVMTPEQYKAAQFQWQMAQAMNPSLGAGFNTGGGASGGGVSGVGNLNNFQVGFTNNQNNVQGGVQNLNQFKLGWGQQGTWGQSAYATPTNFTQPGGFM